MHTERLPNGLVLQLAPRPTAGVASVAVHAGVGFRAEPEHQVGLAHLVEHLMFAGSAHVEPGGHFAAIEAVGGRAGGHTRHDYTELFDVVPAHALTEAVRLEADRLAGPRLDPATLATQVEVIRAEIAQQVDGPPHGGFPWRQLPAAMFDTHAHTHDGYGDVEALARVTVDDAAEFLAQWWAPAGIVVTLDGDLDDVDLPAVREHLAAVPPGRAARPAAGPRLDEPPLAADRHREVHAANAPTPVWAAGFRMPDPRTDPALHGACTALGALLGAQEPALRMTGRSGWYGVPLDARHPDVLVVTTHPRPGVGGEPLLAAVRELLSAWLPGRAAPGSWGTAAARLGLDAYRRSERPAHHARRLGAVRVLFDAGPALLGATDPVAALDRDLLARAAAHLLDQPVGTVLVSPATASSTPPAPGSAA